MLQTTTGRKAAKLFTASQRDRFLDYRINPAIPCSIDNCFVHKRYAKTEHADSKHIRSPWREKGIQWNTVGNFAGSSAPTPHCALPKASLRASPQTTFTTLLSPPLLFSVFSKCFRNLVCCLFCSEKCLLRKFRICERPTCPPNGNALGTTQNPLVPPNWDWIFIQSSLIAFHDLQKLSRGMKENKWSWMAICTIHSRHGL